MTISVLIDVIDRAGALRLEDGLQSVTSAADGSMTDSGIKIDDPTGSITILPWMTVVITESDCSQPRCFTGYVYSAQISRGPYVTGPGRVWILEVTDLNALLKLRAFHAADAKRPEETVTDRMTWLLASVGLSGLVWDNGLIGAVSSTFTVGPRDYRQDGYALDVLTDCVVVQRVFFVYWDASATPGQEPSLFFYGPDDAVKSSSLKISNVRSDVDGTTTFFGYISPDLTTAGEEIFDGLVWIDPDRIIYRQLASTYTTYQIHRDGRVNTDRVRSASRASNLVDEWLTKHSVPLDTIAVTIRLPTSKVNLIEAGDRVQVKFSHLPGFTSFTWTRVTRRTLTFTPGTNEFYDVQLELSVRGLDIIGGSGGSPGSFPHPPIGGVSVVQTALFANSGGTSTVTLPNDVGVGNLLVAVVGWRATTGVPSLPANAAGTPFTDVGHATASPLSGFSSDTVSMSYRIAETGDGKTFHCPTSLSLGNVFIITEYAGSWPTNPVDTSATGAGNGVHPTVNVTPTAGGNGVVVSGAINLNNNTPSDSGYVAGAGYTMEGQSTDIFGNAVTGMIDQLVSAASGTYTPNMTASSGFPGDGSLSSWGTVGAFFAQDVSANPPFTPQEVLGETVVTTAGVGTTQYPYAAGSLVVYVDGVKISKASYTETNPAAGTFTLSWTPDPSETVKVDYAGI